MLFKIINIRLPDIPHFISSLEQITTSVNRNQQPRLLAAPSNRTDISVNRNISTGEQGGRQGLLTDLYTILSASECGW